VCVALLAAWREQVETGIIPVRRSCYLAIFNDGAEPED